MIEQITPKTVDKTNGFPISDCVAVENIANITIPKKLPIINPKIANIIFINKCLFYLFL